MRVGHNSYSPLPPRYKSIHEFLYIWEEIGLYWVITHTHKEHINHTDMLIPPTKIRTNNSCERQNFNLEPGSLGCLYGLDHTKCYPMCYYERKHRSPSKRSPQERHQRNKVFKIISKLNVLPRLREYHRKKSNHFDEELYKVLREGEYFHSWEAIWE